MPGSIKTYLYNAKPELKAEWHPTKNTLDFYAVGVGTSKKAWWICAREHEWEAYISSRSQGSGCPYCSGRLPIVGKTDLSTVNPSLAAEWHPIKNTFGPKTVTANSGKKIWWLGKCKHEWKAQIAQRNLGSGCPYCAGIYVLPGFNDFATICPSALEDWDYSKNSFLPNEITASSNKKAWFKCQEGHTTRHAIYDYTRHSSKCTICSGKTLLTGFNDFATTHPDRAEEWHPTKNGSLLPSMVLAGSGKKVWWKCLQGHEWQAQINSRKERNGCGQCSNPGKSKVELQLVEQFEKEDEFEIIGSAKLLLSTLSRPITVDLQGVYKNIKFVVEYDGCYWHSFDKATILDVVKTKALIQDDFHVVRVREQTAYKRLAKVDLLHEKLFQIDYLYSVSIDHDFADLIKQVKNWLIESDKIL